MNPEVKQVRTGERQGKKKEANEKSLSGTESEKK